MLALGDDILAPYAVQADAAGPRRYPEPEHAYRSPLQRDRDRILHCAAFRRLAYKTQVYTGDWGDYHRSRLTHTLEVSALARSLARALRLNEDLTEALALMHDLGHPPLGHAGEEVLNELSAHVGGFNHNQQALRIVEKIEQRYPDFPGLNLCAATLQGQQFRAAKHGAGESPTLEVQLVDAADSIAYDAHDADDALEMGLVQYDELCETKLWREADAMVAERFGRLDLAPRRRAVVRALLDRLAGGLFHATSQAIASARPTSVDDVLQMPPLVRLDEATEESKRELEGFLFDRVYRGPVVLKSRQRHAERLARLVELYLAQPELIPTEFRAIEAEADVVRTAVDYVACMTDRGFTAAWRRLADPGGGG